MSKIIQIIFVLIISGSFFVPKEVFGADLYVDGVNGDNNNSGVSLESAWKTIDYGMTNATPGDTVFITGGIYKENVKIYSKGSTEREHITVKNYDDNEVILDGSLTASGWSVYAGEIYQTSIADSEDIKVDAVVCDYVALKPAVTQTNINAHYVDTTNISEVIIKEGQFYQDNSTDILYVWVPGGGSPASHDLGLVRYTPDTSNQYDGIYLWDSGYFSFENLTIRFFGARGIEATGGTSHNNYTNVKVKFNRHSGIISGHYSNLLNSEIAWNFLWNWPRGKFNGGTQGGGWGAGVGLGSYSNAINNQIYKNGGEGLLTYLNPGHSVFRGNTVYDNWSMNLYVDTVESVVVENNLVYCASVDETEKENNGFPNDGTVYKGQHPIGISTAEEFYGGEKKYYLRDIDIRNNIIINCRRGYNHYAQADGSGMVRIKFVNNTIVVPNYQVPGNITVGDGDNFLGIFLNNSKDANKGNIIKNNIVISQHQRNYALYNRDDDVDSFESYGLSNNLFYNSDYSKPIHWGESYSIFYDYTLEEWQSLSGTSHGINSISVDPLFVGGTNLNEAMYYKLLNISTAIGAGVAIADYSTDYNGKTRTTPWTIGAHEFNESKIIIRSDVNQDFKINTTDAMLALRDSLGLDMTETTWQVSVTTGDVNCDDVSDSIDAMLLLRYSLGFNMSGTEWCEQIN